MDELSFDLNDNLNDSENNNIFLPFLEDRESYIFVDEYFEIDNYSYPSYPSHIDHILISNEVFDYHLNTETIKLDNYMVGGWGRYDSYVSDHRPVGISLLVLD